MTMQMENNKTYTVLVPLAPGCEELEAVTIIDLLRRAGIAVTTAGLDDQALIASRGTRLIPDTDLDSALQYEYDMVVLPGGLPGAEHLGNDLRITTLLKKMAADQRGIAAICAAPKVLLKANILSGKKITAYPGLFQDQVLDNITLLNKPVVKDGHIITGSGPGAAMDFALTLIETLAGEAMRIEVETALFRPANAAA